MAMVSAADNLNLDLLAALGIDSGMVQEFTLHAQVGAFTTITVRRVGFDEEARPIEREEFRHIIDILETYIAVKRAETKSRHIVEDE